MPSHSLLRLGRAAVFAAVCTALALTGHVAASDVAVAPWTVGAGCALMTALALLLTGHERSLPTILGGLFGGQFTLHVLFAAGQANAAAADLTAHPGHGVPDVPDGHGGAGMTVAHYAAALAAAWWLRRGEHAVWRLAREVTALALAPARALFTVALVLPPGLIRVPPAGDTVARPAGRILRHAVSRRGPPVRSRVLALG
jgi:hypothetical protein